MKKSDIYYKNSDIYSKPTRILQKNSEFGGQFSLIDTFRAGFVQIFAPKIILSTLGLPRGCWDDLLQTLSALNIKPVVHDQRNSGQPLKATFQGELRPEPTVAAQAMLAQDMGVLAATRAFGKTVVAARLIAQRGVNTLALVHRRQLQQQWVERLSAFLGMPVRAIGR